MGAPAGRGHRGFMRWYASCVGTPRGHVLVDVLWTALLVAILAGIAVPLVRSTVHRVQATAAREAVVGFVGRVRTEARARGGAVLVVAEAEDRLALRTDGREVDRLAVGREFGVDLEAGGGGEEVLLRFDERGLGMVASRTLVVRRGRAQRAAVLSSYGRVARR